MFNMFSHLVKRSVTLQEGSGGRSTCQTTQPLSCNGPKSRTMNCTAAGGAEIPAELPGTYRLRRSMTKFKYLSELSTLNVFLAHELI